MTGGGNALTVARMILIGFDPGLERTGWGVIGAEGNRLTHIASGYVVTRPAEPLCARLAALFTALEAVIARHSPDAAAVEETYVNTNPRSTLKLGQARGVVLLAAARIGHEVGQYPPATIKKAVVGSGQAEKAQVHAMVRVLLPGSAPAGPDAADALAVAICHAHHLASRRAYAPPVAA